MIDFVSLMLGTFCAAAMLLHLASITIAMYRCRPRRHASRSFSAAVSVVRPLSGIDNHLVATLGSGFTLAHPTYELILCIARNTDAAIGVAHHVSSAHPKVQCRLLIDDERISGNPKLDNLIKGWRVARHDWIVLADSNVLMPPDYLDRLLARWREDTGLVCSPPIGTAPLGAWAELECCFLNSYQARWQYAADSAGFGFAQGKTMLWRRDFLEGAGGICALGSEIAEDAAATKLVRRARRRVHLVDAPFAQPLGYRGLRDVWNRQIRWARLRRASFQMLFAAEIFSGAALPLAALAAFAALNGTSVIAPLSAFATAWYGAEILLCAVAGWPLSWRSPALMMLRDAALPVVWIAGWQTHFTWRGHKMQALKASVLSTIPTEV